ncbi:MAG: endo-1,4-beta-xylanase [Candidatus Binatia bacterium]
MSAAIDHAGAAACGERLARIGRRACRAAVAVESVALRAPSQVLAARAAAAGRLRARLERQWPPACAAGLPAGSAAALQLDLAAGAAGVATTRGLGAIAAESGRVIGAAIEPDEVAGDAAFAAALAHDVTSLTAENAMKWEPSQPAPDQWRLAPADAVVAIADANQQRLRGHTLIWGASQLSAYAQNAASAAELRGYMADHVAALMGRYAGRIAQWDVVNEPLSGFGDAPTPDGLDDNVFRRLLGPGYLAEALQLARAADPRARLFVNENGIEVPGPKQDRFYALVQDLLAAGAPLDGVGFQAHLGLAPPARYPDRATIEASLRRFADLGLDVELTELDVTLAFRSGDVATRIAGQAADYRAAVAACLAVPRLHRHHHLGSERPLQLAALLLRHRGLAAALRRRLDAQAGLLRHARGAAARRIGGTRSVTAGASAFRPNHAPWSEWRSSATTPATWHTAMRGTVTVGTNHCAASWSATRRRAAVVRASKPHGLRPCARSDRRWAGTASGQRTTSSCNSGSSGKPQVGRLAVRRSGGSMRQRRFFRPEPPPAAWARWKMGRSKSAATAKPAATALAWTPVSADMR